MRVPIAREEMRLPERKKALFSTTVGRESQIQKPSELFDASNHAFCYAQRIV
jgi:hypothetical protein